MPNDFVTGFIPVARPGSIDCLTQSRAILYGRVVVKSESWRCPGVKGLRQFRAQKPPRLVQNLFHFTRILCRQHSKIDIGEGEITSGGYSPTIGRSIALARVPAGDYDRAQVDVRGKLLNVRIVKTPFVRNGEIRIDV